MDFIGVTSLLIFQPGVTEQCIDIIIVNDSALENDERFFVQLITADDSVDLTPSIAEVIISDDDG